MVSSAPNVTGLALLLEAPEPHVVLAFTNPEILFCTGFYLVLKPLLKMTPLVDRRKGAYKRTMIGYNLMMAVFSAACFVAMTTAVGWDRGYGAALLAWSGDSVPHDPLLSPSCSRAFFKSYLFRTTGQAFYYSKYVEFLDTAWLVLKGKEVSFLQTFHHLGAPWAMYLLVVFENEGIWLFVWLNSFVHTIMYMYYALSAAGISCPAKPLITLMQICQFVWGLHKFWSYKNVPCFRANQGLMISFAYIWAYVGIVLLLFVHFFANEYLCKKKKENATTTKRQKRE